MLHLGLIEAIMAEREREIEAALRQRRLMKPEDNATEPSSQTRRANDRRALAMRVRPTAGG